MSKNQVGEVGWDDVRPKGGDGQSIFLNMKEPGEYKIRVVSNPHQYFCHWVETPEGARKKVNCLDDGKHEGNCPVCIDSGKGPQFKWLLRVIHRTQTGSVLCLLDCGSQILSQIKRLNGDPDYGKIVKYDIKVTKGQRNANPLYTVLPCPPAELSEEEKALVKSSLNPESDNFIDVNKLCQPSTLEQINKILGKKPGKEAANTDDFDISDDNEFIDL